MLLFSESLVAPEEQFELLHPRIPEIVDDLVCILSWLEHDARVTSMVRPANTITNESGVHSTGRAIDVVHQARKHSPRLEIPDLVLLSKLINLIYPRKDNFKTCLYHKGTDWHFHIQVPMDKAYKDINTRVPVITGKFVKS